MEFKSLGLVKAIQWIGKQGGYLKLIDQSQLPHKLRYLVCRDANAVYQAIKSLKIRGAPAIGIAAAFGLFLGARKIKATYFTDFTDRLKQIRNRLLSARPTAVNLAWALERMMNHAGSGQVKEIKKRLFKEARRIHQEDIVSCTRIGKNGARLIRNGYGVLTYCNTGFLATGGAGTALSVIYQAKRAGKKFRVYVPETRPMLQGARLTAWELSRLGGTKIDTTLICDNMAGRLMQEGKINIVFVGADRIVANGDIANKIGTYSLALLAHYHKIPFYVAAPYSSFDSNVTSGSRIPIEYRSDDEVTTIAGKRMAPRHSRLKVYNPAFDITPARFIKGIITESGIIKSH